MMRRLLILSLSLIGLIGLIACGGEEETPATLANVQAQVFNKSCNISGSCHVGAAPVGGLNLSDPVAVDMLLKPAVANPMKQLVVPGNPDGSFFIDKLRNRDVNNMFMPPGQPLDEARLSLVERWIAAGAPAN